MEQTFFAGLDVSTQSCKLVIIDPAKQSIVYIDAVNYDNDLPQYKTHNGTIPDLSKGASESDPRMWIDAVKLIFQKLTRTAVPIDKIRCISVSGQQHGLVALDSLGNLACFRSKLWNDFSTQEECDLLTAAVGGKTVMIEAIGNSQKTGYTASKILHMRRHEPAVYQKVSTFFLVHNYINWYLTGGAILMEPGDTSGMALWNLRTGKWSKPVINAIDPGLSRKLPPVKPADRSIGFISPGLVETYGFSPQCKVDAGSGDNMYGAVGTGNVCPDIVSVSLGSSGTAFTLMKEPYLDPEGEIAAFCDSTGQFLSLLCVSNMANGYDSLIKQHGITHNEFDRIIKKTNAGNSGKTLVPWYEGERTPNVPLASPLYFGFSLGDFTLQILARAVLEGHVLNLHHGFRRLPVNPKEIRLTGGISQSDSWCQTIADVFEAETVPVKSEGAALGAAIHAAWVWEKESGCPGNLEALVSIFVKLQIVRLSLLNITPVKSDWHRDISRVILWRQKLWG